MKNIRIGNDIKIVWALCDESGPISLLDKSVCVFLQNRYDKIPVENFEVSGNIISFTFFGKNQRVGGDYSLVAVLNAGKEQMNSVDVTPAFCLVEHSRFATPGNSVDDLDVETLELTSVVYLGGNGSSAVEQGSAPRSALIKDTYAEATNEAATAFGGVEYFVYHEGKDDERIIDVPNPTAAHGLSSSAEGIGAIASGVGAHAEGNVAITHDSYNKKTGEWEQTIIVTEASGRGSHAEGLGTKSRGSGSHSEGIGTEVEGNSGHGEGYYTKIHDGEGTHTEGMQSDANGNAAHAEGYHTFAKGTAAHAEGRGCIAKEYGAHAEGGYVKLAKVELNLVPIDISESEYIYEVMNDESWDVIVGLGCNLRDGSAVYIINVDADTVSLSKEVPAGSYIFSNVASGTSSHSEGALTVASGDASHAEGKKTKSIGEDSHAEGYCTIASGNHSHAEGDSTNASGKSSHAEGCESIASGLGSHAEGGYWNTDKDNCKGGKASGNASHAEGLATIASGKGSHAEGLKTMASGPSAHAEGEENIAGGDCSHVEGYLNETTKTGAHLEGRRNKADGNYAHVEGANNVSDGSYSHTEGVGHGYILGIRSGKSESTLYEVPSIEDRDRISVGDKVYRNGYKEVIVKDIYGGDSKWIKLSDKIGHIRPYDEDDNLTYEKVLFISAEGQMNRASGVGSHAEGIGTQTSNYGESAVGRFNESRGGLIFSVGNGTSDEERKNAFEVYDDGVVYFGLLEDLVKAIDEKLPREEFENVIERYAFSDDLQELREKVDRIMETLGLV